MREIEAAIEPIARGDLGRRLPVSGRGDEVDLLATIVNRMLGEIERLIGEVKGVCDNIAHDLRTPLTRLRAQLHRLQQTGGGEEGIGPTLEHCIVDVDSLLDRFRALLRISELEDLRRRGGFGNVDLGAILHEVHELYAPLAEDNAIAFRVEPPLPATVHGDPHLLFEAFSNLVANAIKFTPRGGMVSRARVAGAARGRASTSSTAVPASRAASAMRCCNASIAANGAAIRGRKVMAWASASSRRSCACTDFACASMTTRPAARGSASSAGSTPWRPRAEANGCKPPIAR